MYGLGSKERIFHAAMSVALRHGFGRVTLNLVASDAGLSKGGLLYHFATKNDLIRAMLEHYADAAARHALPPQLGGANSTPSDLDRFVVAVLVAAADNPVLLEPLSMQLRSDEFDLTGRSESMPGHLRLIADLVAKFNLATPAHKKRPKNEAFVVRHRADETLLGLFVAQDVDTLRDMVGEFSDPAEYEYCPAPNGALILSNSEHEPEVDASIAASRARQFECGGELNGSLVDIMIAKEKWTPFHAADEGSGGVSHTLDQPKN